MKTSDPTIAESVQQTDLERREFLRKGVKLAYVAPVIFTLSVATDSAAYNNGSGKCPPGWEQGGGNPHNC